MKHFISVFTCCLLLVSCKKQGPVGPQGETGSPGNVGETATTPKGTISGIVSQFDEFSKKLNTGLNTITVTISGTDFSSVTNEKGVYTLPDVPAGTYNLEFKGPKTNVLKTEQLIFVGNGTLYHHVSICNKPTWTFLNLTVQTFPAYLKINGNYSNTNSFPKAMLALFSLSPDIDPTDPSTYDFMSVSNPTVNLAFNTPGMPGYPAGTIHYLKILPVNPSFSYLKAETQETVYYCAENLSSSVYTLTMPTPN